MKRKKPKSMPTTVIGEPSLKLKPVPAVAGSGPASEPKFMPPVSLSYESTLDLKPIPAAMRKPRKKPPLRAGGSKGRQK